MSDRTSFYGGPSGQSFEIKKIFANKVEMLADLQMRWQSSIGVSDFVVISYGLPGKQEDIFLANQDIDLGKFQQSYNSTLWQKIYTENDRKEIDALRGIETYYISGSYGLGYKLIASMSGNTPRFKFYTKVLHSYEKPYWQTFTAPSATYPETANAGIDRPVLIAFLPMQQVVTVNRVSLNAEDDPVFFWDTQTNSYTTPSGAVWDKVAANVDRTSCGAVKNSYDSDHNAIEDGNDKPILWLGVPPGWDWDLDYDTLAANQEPTVSLSDDGNKQTLKIRLPRTWKWTLDHTILNAKDNPVVKLTANPATDTQTLKVDIPRPWGWDLDFSLDNADENPTADLSNDGNIQTLALTLPRAWDWQLTGTNGTYTILNADEKPKVVLTDDGNIQYLEFKLPQAQVMADPDTTIVGPIEDPSVDLNDDDINSPKLTFNLPRAVRFYYGGFLGERTAVTYTIDDIRDAAIEDCKPGDYYVNQPTGFIYLITDLVDYQATLQYKACIQAPLPAVSTNSIDPYTADGENKVDPSVVSTFDDPVEMTGWNLQFNLPHLPDFSVTHDFVGPDESGNVELVPTAEDNVNFHLSLPRGAKIFAGDQVFSADQNDMLDNPIADALPGDLYLNTQTGAVYKLNSSKSVWMWQSDGLRGPAGEPLHHIATYTIQIDENDSTTKDNLKNGYDVIKANFTDPITSDMVFTVIWIDEDEKQTAYWYYKQDVVPDSSNPDSVWTRAQVTSGASILIEDQRVEDSDENPITNKTYSIHYINKLIGGNITDDNKDVTAFSKEQIYALFSWSDFEDANDEQWWPADDGGASGTLSKEEVIQLASWGDIASLMH